MLYDGLDWETAKSGRSKCRNAAIAEAFQYMHIVERWGTGIPRIIKQCREYGLEPPVFEEIGDGVRVILFRKNTESGFGQIKLGYENPKSNHESPKSNYENPNLDAKSGYQDFEEVYFTPGNKSERNIQKLYEVIGTNRSFGRNEIMEIINCSKSTAANLLNEMENKNFIRKVKGRGKYVFDKQLHILQ